MRGRARAVLLVVVSGLLLVGCGSAPSTGSSYGGGGSGGGAPASAPATGGVAAEGSYLQFGAPYSIPAGTWDVRTSRPRPYKRTAAAAGGEEGTRFIRVDITVVNRTQRYIDVGQEWQITMGVDGSPASEVFDTDVEGSAPSGKLAAPGKAVTWGAVWALADAPATIQVGMDPNSDPSGQSHVLYQGRV